VLEVQEDQVMVQVAEVVQPVLVKLEVQVVQVMVVQE
jgi:hypothetical protein